MKVMITGAAGFIGPYLARHSSQMGSTVLGIDHRDPETPWVGAAAFELCDVRDEGRLSELVSKFQPDRVFHLAAQSYPTISLIRPRETLDSNVGGTINLFESLRALKIMPMVVVACSSAEYGPVASQDLPVRETHSLSPLHPYGVSKVAQDLLAAQYFLNYGIPTIRIRIFNTTGPGKRGDVCSDLARRAVEMELGIRPPVMLVGNTTNRRAIVDVRDFVRGIWLAADHCKAGEVYNLGAEKIYSVQEIIDEIHSQLGIKFKIEREATLVRACDELVIAGDISKFRNCCSWEPKIDLATTIRDMLEWWRLQLAKSVESQPSVKA
jgi:GDP-4-dehydro-6-deoxy-D-mannose reductase